jgi:hypothetical protein
MRTGILSLVAVGALSATPALADPIELSAERMDAVTAGFQAGTSFGQLVSAAQQGRDIPGEAVSKAAQNPNGYGLGDTQTGQIRRNTYKGEANAFGIFGK